MGSFLQMLNWTPMQASVEGLAAERIWRTLNTPHIHQTVSAWTTKPRPESQITQHVVDITKGASEGQGDANFDAVRTLHACWRVLRLTALGVWIMRERRLS
jgi:hypothetical protein